MSDPAPPRTGRRVAAAILTVLTCVALVASVVAVWAGRTLLDTPTFSRTAADALTDPEVASALGDRLADEGVDLVWDAAELDRRVPDVLEPYADSLADGLRTQLAAAATAVLEAPTTHEVLETNLERAHRTLLTVLEGDGDLPDDAVRLNLIPVLSRALLRLQDRGILPASLDLPTFEAGGDADDQIAELEEAVGRSLPDDFAQLTIYEGAAVGKASTLVQSGRDALALARRAMAGLVIVTVALAVGALVVSPRRRRTLVALGVGALVATLLAALAVRAIQSALPSLVAEPHRDAAGSLASTFLDGLVDLSRGLALLGALVAVAGLLADASARTRLRRAGDGLTPVAADHAPALRVAIVVAGLLALSFVGLRATTFLVAVLAVAAALLLVEALRQRST